MSRPIDDLYPGLAPSDISQGLYDGTVRLCPDKLYQPSDADQILSGLMRDVSLVTDGCARPCKTISILRLGVSDWRFASAVIEVNGMDLHTGRFQSRVVQRDLCRFCPRRDDCF